jgi:hypothetical protein
MLTRIPETVAPLPCSHSVQFYETDAFLLGSVAEFLAPALREDGIAIVIATRAHLDGISEQLSAIGLDPVAMAASGRLVPLNAESTLARIMGDTMPDEDRFRQVIGGILDRLPGAGGPVHVYGEMVALLAADGLRVAAVRLEELWNEIQQERAFSLLCAYPMAACGGEDQTGWIGDVCAAHSHVIPAESYSALPTELDRLHTIVSLQQKALRLESETLERLASEERLLAALAAEQSARREAQATKALHDNLLTDAAHELRNPLTGLALNAQLTLRQLGRDGQFDPQRVEQALLAITAQAAKMSMLLDRLLDVPHVEAPTPAAAPGNGALTPEDTHLLAGD